MEDSSASDRSAETRLLAFGDRETRLRAFGHSILLVLAAIAFGALIDAAGTEILSLVGVTEETNPVIFHGSSTVWGLLGFLVAAIGYLVWYADSSLVRLRSPTRSDAVWLVLGTVLFLIAMSLAELAVSLFDVETAENVAIEQGREHPELFLLLLPIQFLLTAPAEELLFRGVIQGLFRRAYGIVPGILIAAVLFGFVHYPALAVTDTDGIFVVIAILTVTGAVLGALYEYTGNLLVPIFVHALWNTLVFGNQYLNAVGAV